MIGESVQVTKGPNAVISYFHSFLERHGIGETHMRLHADNCSGQNKNNAMELKIDAHHREGYLGSLSM